jgi:hypothetical protein
VDSNPSAPEQNKSEIPVEAPEPGTITELQRALTPRLSEEDERTLADRILTDYYNALSDRREWEARLVEWEDAYYNRTRPKTFPWPGASNFHVPLTMSGVETYKPRLVEAVLGQQPPIIVVPTTAASEDRKTKVETVLNWQVQSKLKLEGTVTQSAHLFLQPGLAVAKTYWKVDRRWRKYVRDFAPDTPIQAIFEAIFSDQKPRKITKLRDQKYKGFLPGAPPLEFTVEFDFLPERIEVLIEREEIEEGPHVELIEPIDLIVPVKGGHEIKDLPWKQHRLWLNEDDLRRKVLEGRFYEDAVTELLNSGTPRGDKPAMDSGGYRASQDNAEGVEGQGPSNVRMTQWDILEDYRRYDIDGDGLDEDVIVWVSVHVPTKILGWDYLDNVYATGRCPLRVGRFHPVPFRFYGLSYAEMIRGIQEEINAIHNQRIDSGTLANLPWGFKRASSTLPPIQQRIKPGEFIDIDNPQQDILIPKFNVNTAWGQQEEATLMQYKERLDGLSDLSMGKQPNRVGATRTAKGTQTLLSEAGLRYKTAMQSFQRFWVGIFEDILALDQEHLPPRQEFRITGRRPSVVRLKDRTEIRGQYDLRLSATTDNLNRDQMREDATIVMQATLNPALIQVGLVGMKGVKRVVSKFLKAYGEDPDFILEEATVTRNPVEELMLFNIGQYVPPSPGPHLQSHLTVHQAALQDPAVPQQVKRLIQRYIQEASQMLRAMQMAQMMGPGPAAAAGPQAQNAAIGALPQGQPGGGTSPQAGMPQAMAGANGAPQR